jgi:putative ABC transport system permease protein
VGLAGAFTVQQLGFADVNMGIGMIIRGLAAVMIGEVLLRPKSVGQALISACYGMILFEVMRAWVFTALSLDPSDVRLASALVVLVALASPYVMNQYRAWDSRRKNRG